MRILSFMISILLGQGTFLVSRQHSRDWIEGGVPMAAEMINV